MILHVFFRSIQRDWSQDLPSLCEGSPLGDLCDLGSCRLVNSEPKRAGAIFKRIWRVANHGKPTKRVRMLHLTPGEHINETPGNAKQTPIWLQYVIPGNIPYCLNEHTSFPTAKMRWYKHVQTMRWYSIYPHSFWDMFSLVSFCNIMPSLISCPMANPVMERRYLMIRCWF